MDIIDSATFLIFLLGGLGAVFLVASVIADVIIPYLEERFRDPQ